MSKSNPPKSSQPKRGVDKAKQILQGALPEFLQHGYSCTSMDRIARAAGVSKQTLYSYYNDKDGLFTALIENMTQQKFQVVWSKPLTGTPETVLRELANRILKGIQEEEYLNFIRLIVSQSGKRADLCQLFLKTVSQPAIQHLTQYFEQNQELQLKDAEATAGIFIGSIVYFIMSQELFHGKEIMPMNSDRFVNNLIDLVLSSHKKPPLTSGRSE
jgi:AcrR family transcriptional regulator